MGHSNIAILDDFGVALKSAFRKPVTDQCPDSQKERQVSSRYTGRHIQFMIAIP